MVNKYIKAFREACEKLEEDDGNPSRMQALNYDIDNEELQNEQENLSKALGFLGKAYYLIVTIKNEYPENKKIINLLNKIKDSQAYIEDLRTNPDHNRIKGFYRDHFDKNQNYKYRDLQNDDYKYFDKNYDKVKERNQNSLFNNVKKSSIE